DPTYGLPRRNTRAVVVAWLPAQLLRESEEEPRGPVKVSSRQTSSGLSGGRRATPPARQRASAVASRRTSNYTLGPTRRQPAPVRLQLPHRGLGMPLFGALQLLHARVESSGGHELLVPPALDDAAAIEDEDAVGPADGREPVGDDKRRPPLLQRAQPLEDELLR